MSNAMETLDLERLAESVDLECKGAQGKDGQGELPQDFWKTYCAMANTDGGVILLGVQEKPTGQFRVLGLKNVERVRKALWDNLNNPKQVNTNLLKNDDVQPISLKGKTILQVRVPRAERQRRPVFLGSTPFGGTYLRLHEGDYPADKETVQRLIAENSSDSRDHDIVPRMSVKHLDAESVARYRRAFAVSKPGHIWADIPTDEFLTRIGAYGHQWHDGTEGVRLAGLLMFGRAEVIRDVLPYYMVDYQEQSGRDDDARWIDRLIPDGSWSGNIYDFFSKTYQKLTAGLKVPFQLKEGQRIEDTPAHEAIREALVNTLIHADYHAPKSILIIKRPDSFSFRNPGRMRISLESALHGGLSDCRNRHLQHMFQLVGFGDQAGSGVPKIFKRWASQHWVQPQLTEDLPNELTTLELRMISLVLPEVEASLTARFGSHFKSLSEDARMALITAESEGAVSNQRLKQMTVMHPADISKLLRQLVNQGYLQSEGVGRGTLYRLAYGSSAQTADLFELSDLHTTYGIENTGVNTPDHRSSYSIPPEHSLQTTRVDTRNHRIRLHITEVTPPYHWTEQSTSPRKELADASEQTEEPLYLDWDAVPALLQGQLTVLAQPVSSRKRIDPALLQSTILALCEGRFLGPRVLAQLLNRDIGDLRKRTLTPMVHQGLLRLAYPAPNAPRQAYTSATKPPPSQERT